MSSRDCVKPLRWAVLISGRGSNLAALLISQSRHQIVGVFSNAPSAYGMKRAKRQGVVAECIPLQSNKPDFDWLEDRLKNLHVERIFLAGFMRVLPKAFVSRWAGKVINLHPSLLPQYPGLKSIERAYNDRATVGCSVHEVTEVVDDGKVICQRALVHSHDSFEEVERRLHLLEQRLVAKVAWRW